MRKTTSRGLVILFGLGLLSLASFAASSEVADAVQARNIEALRGMIQKKADVNAPQLDGSTALHWAAQWNNLEAADLLIRAGAKVDAPNRDGATPLFLAALNGSRAMIEKLLNAGADVNAPVLSHGETALMLASRSGSKDAVQLLLDRGAQVNARENLRGTTALMWAAEQNHSDIIRLLLQQHADVNAVSAVLKPPRRRGLGFANPNAPGETPAKGGLTALLFAVREGGFDSVKTLVASGAQVNQPSIDGSSPLLVAVQNGFYGFAGFLIEHGADVNLANAKGWSPLYLAVKNRDQESTAIPGPSTEGVLDFTQFLLEHKADPNVRIKADTEIHQGMTAAWLKEAGATPLLRAAICGDLTVVKMLLNHGADPQIPTFDHTTPLMVAAGVGWADGLLREYSEDETLEVVKLLLERGSDVNLANDHGITALHGAGYKGANKVVQFLVDRGANLAAQDNGEDFGFGKSSVRMTPLNWAEGVPIGMSSAIYHTDTVALLTRLMTERGIPVVSNTFHGRKPDSYPVIGEP
ncbi:MAG TPA: ankyrin repeat domain-containing protein [Bryobacteraceae bacterium]|nr:ankyrin repeat domain-containing protein [Bryobacteraceae bacterium]